MPESGKKVMWPGAGLWSVLFILMACATTAAVPSDGPDLPSEQTDGPPNLVVVVIVDQLRGDLLNRYASLFTGGFKRLLDQGLVFSNALHAHAQTETAPGHATISTGVVPSRAGIPSNVWQEGEDGDLHPVYNVVDPSEDLVGISGLPGSSPSVLRRTGLADWVQDAESDAKVVSVSAKDRGAILMAGKSKGEVYWFDSHVGRFVTSTYYRSGNPSWLDRFNEKGMREFFSDTVWTSTVPAEATSLSAPDTADFEGDGVHTFFPHRFSEEVVSPGEGDFYYWFETTPMLDRATLEVALLAIDREGLGESDERTDFLSVSFSQTDRVGHAYGPLSREQMDNLLRLDLILGDLFSDLDERVGRQNYLVGFTSDHGIMNNPERIEGGGLRLTADHRSHLQQSLSVAARKAGSASGLSASQAMVDAISDIPFVGPAYTHSQLLGPAQIDSLGTLFRHSITPGRAGGLLSRYGVEMWWAKNTLSWGLPVGTTHGSPFYYDRWVPLILMGPGIESGTDQRGVRPMDLSPTLALLAGIPFPDDLDGKPLIGGLD